MGGERETPLSSSSSSILAHFFFCYLKFETTSPVKFGYCATFFFVHHLGGIAPLWIWLESAELIFPDDDEGENTGWDY